MKTFSLLSFALLPGQAAMGKHKHESEGILFRQDHLFFPAVLAEDSGVGARLIEGLFP